MKLLCGVGIIGSLVLVTLGGCSNAAREVSRNDAPEAQVTLASADQPARVGVVLQGSYQYSDSDGDRESGTLKAWLRDGQLIEGADQDSYTATAQDSGKKLQFRVTPTAASGKSPGAAALSFAITIENSPPSIAGLTILSVTASGIVTNEAYSGQVLTASYVFNDLDLNREEGSLYQWWRGDAKISGAMQYSYTVLPADIGYAISVQVTPRDNENKIGALYQSPAVKVVNMAPMVSNVVVEGQSINQAGDTLRVKYTYTDREEDIEAGSQFRWLRDGAAITSATGRVYAMTLADVGKTITAEVTPIAQIGAPRGTPVVSNPITVAAANVVLAVSAGLKQLHFSWAPVHGASSYRVSYSPDGGSKFVLLAAGSDNLIATAYDWDIAVHFVNWSKAQFLLEACDTTNTCLPSNSISALNVMLGTIGYFKSSNAGINDKFGTSGRDEFGYSVALSADGLTLAIGAPGEDGGKTGVTLGAPDEATTGNGAYRSGAVYIFTRNAGIWVQQAYVKASNTGNGDRFGSSVALSGDGKTLAVGAPIESSATLGIKQGAPDEVTTGNGALYSGAVYVYARSPTNWYQQAYVKASNTEASDWFGTSVALSADGNTLAVGANGEDGATLGITLGAPDETVAGNGTTTASSGAVYVYTRNELAWWFQAAYIKASNAGGGDQFGISVALSADATTLAVGAPDEDGANTGVDSTADDSAQNAGAAYIYSRSGNAWSQQAYVKPSNRTGNFGYSIALNGNGHTLAVGARGENSAATGVGGDQVNGCANTPVTNCALGSGAAYVFTRSATTWLQQAYVKALNAETGDGFGFSVALSDNGNTLAVGANGEDSATLGVTLNTFDETITGNGAFDSGVVYIYTRNISTWSQKSYVKATNPGNSDSFGSSIALSSNGDILAIGADSERSAATGVNNTEPGQSDDSLLFAGAVYLY